MKLPLISSIAGSLELVGSAVEVAVPIVKSSLKGLRHILDKKPIIVVDHVDAELEKKLKSFESEAVHTSLRQLQLAVVQFNRTQLKILEKLEALTEQVVHGSSATEELTHEVSELLELVKDSIEEYPQELEDLENGKNLFHTETDITDNDDNDDSEEEVSEKSSDEMELDLDGETGEELEKTNDSNSQEESPVVEEKPTKKSKEESAEKKEKTLEEKRKNYLRKLN